MTARRQFCSDSRHQEKSLVIFVVLAGPLLVVHIRLGTGQRPSASGKTQRSQDTRHPSKPVARSIATTLCSSMSATASSYFKLIRSARAYYRRTECLRLNRTDWIECPYSILSCVVVNAVIWLAILVSAARLASAPNVALASYYLLLSYGSLDGWAEE